MSIFELEEAICEFVTQNTSELRFRSNEQTLETAPPRVYSGYVPRDEVGAILAGDISTYPAIIVSSQAGNQAELDGYDEMTVAFGLPINENQFNCTVGDGDITPGRYNTWPELIMNPLEN